MDVQRLGATGASHSRCEPQSSQHVEESRQRVVVAADAGRPAITRSIWQEPLAVDRPSFEGHRHSQVVVVGAGITGLTTAAILAQAGKQVCVLEAGAVGRNGTTNRSSAHLTVIPDELLTTLVRRFGEDAMKRTMASLRDAIDLIQRLDEQTGGHANFRRVSAWRYLDDDARDKSSMLLEERDLAGSLGVDACLESAAPLPFHTVQALKISNQAAFHPVRYLDALARFVAAQPACDVFHHSTVRTFEPGDPTVVTTDGGTVSCDSLVLATHSPSGVWLTLHPRLVPIMSYCLTARVASSVPDALFWDCQDPYHYIRRVSTGDPSHILVGGEDHRASETIETHAQMARLERFVRNHFGEAHIECRWSAEFFDSADGLPYIGRAPGDGNTYVATGFSGVGLTFGTAAARLIADLILGIENPWSEVVRPMRVKPLASASETLKEVAATAKGLADRLRRLQPIHEQSISRGEGMLGRIDGRAMAVHRDLDGRLHARSAICPHMGCLVTWNGFERCWMCPCHGSLFTAEGATMAGPAMADLADHKSLVPANGHHT